MNIISRSSMLEVHRLAARLDVGTNPHPTALYDTGSAAINVWCTPGDHPEDDQWAKHAHEITAGAFCKPAEYVGGVIWDWGDISTLHLSTTAYFLRDRNPGSKPHKWENRPADVFWVMKKIRWLFDQAGIPCPEFLVQGD